LAEKYRRPKKVVILGTLDTKGEEHLFLKKRIEERGVQAIVVDTGIVDPPFFPPDNDRREVCAAAGHKIEECLAGKDRKFAIGVMAAGAAKIVRQLYDTGNLDGIISLGGGQGTYISTMAMKNLPAGVPKLMVSTVVSGDVSGYIGHKDIILMTSLTDILGLNSFSRRLFAQAASAICGMVGDPFVDEEKKALIGLTMFGQTTPGVMKIKKLFEAKDRSHDVIVFHARGTGGRAMEELIRDGKITGVIDITTTELADELVGGIRSAGPDRLEAAGEKGIPQLIGPGALDMVNFGLPETVPPRFSGRKFYAHSPLTTLMRTTLKENEQLGELIAEKLNKSKGKTVVMVPTKGFSTIDAEGQPFYDPDADLAFMKGLKKKIHPRIKVLELFCHFNDDEFAEEVSRQFLEMLG
jgi:uncharacterized protein (UPF0261 family)